MTQGISPQAENQWTNETLNLAPPPADVNIKHRPAKRFFARLLRKKIPQITWTPAESPANIPLHFEHFLPVIVHL